MIRLLIIGYSMNIRSERRLCEQVHLTHTYRWFCQLARIDTVAGPQTTLCNRVLLVVWALLADPGKFVHNCDHGL